MTYVSTITAATPLRYWPLDDASGTSARELIASEAGTASGMTMGGFSGGAPAGIGGASPNFNGSGHIVLRTAKLLGGNANFTVEVWIYYSSGTHTFYSETPTANTADFIRGTSTGDTGGSSVGFEYRGDTGTMSSTSTSSVWHQGMWTMFHLVKSGTTYQIWWDGGLRNSTVDTGPSSAWTTAGVHTWVGGSVYGNPGDYWVGSIAHLAAYDRALTASEILAHYEAGTPLTRTLVSFPLFKPNNAVWNQRLDDPANPPDIDAASAATVTKLAAQATTFGVSVNQGGGPMYLVTNATSTQAVRIQGGASNPSTDSPALYNALQAVPIPAGMVTSTSVDQEVTVYNTDTNELWEFWHMRKTLLPPQFVVPTVTGVGTIPSGSNYDYAVVPALSDDTEGAYEVTRPRPITVNGSQAVKLDWAAVDGAAKYRIYRSNVGGYPDTASYKFMTSVAAPTITWTDTGSLTPGAAFTDTITAATSDWGCQYAGYLANVDTDLGHWASPRANWGATATSLPLMAGAVTLLEGMARDIPHALTMAIPSTTDTHVYPAQRHDHFDQGNAVPEGTRFQLDPSYDTSTLANPFLRAVAVAAQKYGMYIRDFSGAVSFYVEDYQGTGRFFNPAMFAGLWDYEVLDAFPFSSLRVIDPAWTLAQTTATSSGATGPYWGVLIGA